MIANLGGGFKYFYFDPYFGKIPISTNIFQRGWNHQVVICHNVVNKLNLQKTKLTPT